MQGGGVVWLNFAEFWLTGVLCNTVVATGIRRGAKHKLPSFISFIWLSEWSFSHGESSPTQFILALAIKLPTIFLNLNMSQKLINGYRSLPLEFENGRLTSMCAKWITKEKKFFLYLRFSYNPAEALTKELIGTVQVSSTMEKSFVRITLDVFGGITPSFSPESCLTASDLTIPMFSRYLINSGKMKYKWTEFRRHS